MLLLAAACAKEPAEQEQEAKKVPLNITITTKAGGNGSGDEATYDVNSIRVAVFKKLGGAASSDLVVVNEYYPNGFDIIGSENGKTDNYTVAVRPVLELDQNTDDYYVYVVLNESGYILKGGDDLPTKLNALADRSEMDALLATPAVYSTGVTEAPYCLMSASKAIHFADTPGAKDRPMDVKFNATSGPVPTGSSDPVDESLRRNMAQITVEGIESIATDGATYAAELPKIFVLDVKLVNVPADMTWSAAPGSTSTNTDNVTLPIGEANAKGYYDRNWDGSVYKDVDVTVTRREDTDARYYRSTWGWDYTKHEQAKNLDKYGWTFDASDAVTFNDPEASKDKELKGVYASAKNHLVAIDEKWQSGNSVDNMITDLTTLFSAPATSDFWENSVKTTNTVTGYYSSTNYAETCSADTWSVNLGDSYYVPENISTDFDAAATTCIKVTLGVADPKINLTGVSATDLPAPGTISGTGTSSFYLENTYLEKNGTAVTQAFNLGLANFGVSDKTKIGQTQRDGKGNLIGPKNFDLKMGNLFQVLGHIVNADDEMIEYTANEDKTNNYKVYVDGFYRETTGLVGRTSVNQNFGSFNWNIPAITSTTGVKEFYIPVNNNLDIDGDSTGDGYSIVRNTKYTVKLYVGENTYDAVTKGSASEDDFGFGVTATVTTEKLTENED